MVVRDFTTSNVDGDDVTVPDVLVAACTTCDVVVGIPHQSTGKINRYRKGETH